MNICAAIGTLFRKRKKDEVHHQLYTQFGESLDPQHVLQEYPRPMLKRDSYLNLNGYWDYAITQSNQYPAAFDGRILVPFSPESVLSGVNRKVMPEDYLWYERKFTIDTDFHKGRILMHFGAVDQACQVYINKKPVIKHVGGYLPFSVDITDSVNIGNNLVTILVKDLSDTTFRSRGKQKLERGGMFYTAQSGIWQSVWMESVPDTYITKIKITPDYDKQRVRFHIFVNQPCTGEITVYENDNVIQSAVVFKDGEVVLGIPEMRSWSPEDPFLYQVTIKMGQDMVESYFAMRKFSIGKDKEGIVRLLLNNKPYFFNGLLDQGYWPDGLLTAPSDEALLYDIMTMKSMGYNTLRKHIKIENERWYYHCDKIGMIVWQDMVNGGEQYDTLLVCYLPTVFKRMQTHFKDCCYGKLGRKSEKGRQEYYRELEETVNLLYNHPCIAMWIPFNEGWGQFDAQVAYQKIKAMDKTRPVDEASGWFAQDGGDIKSIHSYFNKIIIKEEGKPVALTEFGGYACHIDEHSFSDSIYGYKNFNSLPALEDAICKLYMEEIKQTIDHGLSAAIYTQVSDVEDEVNGYITYDRKIVKCSVEKIREMNRQLTEYFDTKTKYSK